MPNTDYLIFNPAAYTHTSIALRDALRDRPTICEVHLSQPQARESFRHVSLFADIALGTIAGFGPNSYYLALEAIHQPIWQGQRMSSKSSQPPLFDVEQLKPLVDYFETTELEEIELTHGQSNWCVRLKNRNYMDSKQSWLRQWWKQHQHQ